MRDIIKLLKRSKKIALFSHSNPDPDTIGSTLALYEALVTMNKQVSVFCDVENGENYAFLEYYDRYNTDDLEGFDLYVSVDVPTNTMFGKFEESFVNFPNTIKLDHHANGAEFSKKKLVKTYSACAILIYEVINKLKVKVTPSIATALYFGICGDTGLFRNSNTDSKTFEVCADLLEKGAEVRRVYAEFFDKRNVPNVRLTSSTLLNAKINDELKYVIMTVSKDDFDKFGVPQSENIGNLPNTYLNCGYKLAVILKEREDGIHCSFRSKFEYDCSVVAAKFGGGGHKNASGCAINEPIEKATELVEKEIQEFLKVEG